MTLKNINLKVPEAEHARMTAVAESEFIPLTSLLRRLFAQYEQSKNGQNSPAANAPKKSKRDQAFEDYHTLMGNLPSVWNEAQYQRIRSTIESLRVAGGNVPHTEMPLPRAMVNWKNASQGYGGIELYDGMSHEQLASMLQEYDASGERPPELFMVAYNISKPAVPE